MKELLDALVTVIQNGYEVEDDSGAKAFKTAEEAAKTFLNWGGKRIL